MSEPIYQAALWSVLFLVATAAVGLLAVAARRRLPLLGRGRRLTLVERLELGERRYLALVRVDDRELLVGVGPQGIAIVEPIPTTPAIRTPPTPSLRLAATGTESRP